ncbi:MAG TPA: TlpA disulfide reductase family protein [Elusimicrobiota bacterium]|jgi:peroxiredoxin|nr:TlpA disulfide reductase family protein [Elusimicrobiota bacterium]
MRKFIVAASFVFSAFLVYTLAMREESPRGPESGRKAPALALPGLDGRAISLADYSGKVVLVDFWATWCPPCREELPALAELDRTFAPKGFSVLGVAMDEGGAKTVREFFAGRPVPYPIALDASGDAPAGWDVPGLPTAYLIGRDGAVRRSWVGAKDADELRAEIEAALAPR